ncbi:MAG: hypothetical protein WCS65_02070 [Verrucomicrobiae bacterium]
MTRTLKPLLYLVLGAFAMKGLAEPAKEKVSVLVCTEWQDANGRCSSVTHALNRFVPMRAMVSDRFRIFETDSYGLAKEDLSRYDVIVLWDFPRALTKEGGAPEEGTRTILSADQERDLLDFVEKGGGLILEGGANTILSEKSPQGGNPQFGLTFFHGFKNAILDQILPGQLEGKDSLKIRDGAAALPGFEDFGSPAQKPTVIGWGKGAGRVGLVCWEGRDNAGKPLAGKIALKGGLRRLGAAWSQEPVLWDRLLRWASASKEPTSGPDSEKLLASHYEDLVSTPKTLPPIEWTAGEYPYMIWVMSMSDPLTFKYFKDLGFNRVSMHTADWVEKNGIPALKSSAANGLWYYPNIDAILFDKVQNTYFKNKEWKKGDPEETMWSVPLDDWNGKFQDGSPARRYGLWGSPFSPLMVETSKKDLQETVGKYLSLADKKDVPYLKGYLMDDEQTWYLPTGYGYAGGKPGLIADYSKFANDYFKKQTGKDAPLPVYREPGYVAPAGDLWLKWVELIRMRGFVPFCQEMCKAIKEKQPGALTGYFGGGFWGEGDIIIDEYYHQMWKEDILKTMSTTDLGFARQNDLLGEKTQYWAEIFCTKSPGCFGGNKGSAIDAEQLRLTAGLAFSRGLKGLIIWETPYLWEMQQPGAETLDKEVQKIGVFLQRYGPMLQLLKREIPPVWYLGGWLHCNSFDQYRWLTPEIGKSPDPSFPWRQFQIDDIAFPALIRAQVQAASVTEQQLMSDELMKRKAVVLPSLQYCRQEVVDNLKKFMAQGGLVFTDQSSPVKIDGATVLPCRFDAWYGDVNDGKRLGGRGLNNTSSDDVSNARRECRIRDLIPTIQKEISSKIVPEITVKHNEADFWDGFASTMTNGDCKYVFVFNNDVKFGRVMNVQMKTNPGTLYDLLDAKLVEVAAKPGTFSFKSQLDAGGWKIYLAAPKPLAAFEVEGFAIAGGTLQAKGKLKDADGNLFKAAVPVRIQITGAERTHTLYRSTNEGEGTFNIPLGDYFGKISRVEFTELLTGKSITKDNK